MKFLYQWRDFERDLFTQKVADIYLTFPRENGERERERVELLRWGMGTGFEPAHESEVDWITSFDVLGSAIVSREKVRFTWILYSKIQQMLNSFTLTPHEHSWRWIRRHDLREALGNCIKEAREALDYYNFQVFIPILGRAIDRAQSHPMQYFSFTERDNDQLKEWHGAFDGFGYRKGNEHLRLLGATYTRLIWAAEKSPEFLELFHLDPKELALFAVSNGRAGFGVEEIPELEAVDSGLTLPNTSLTIIEGGKIVR